MTPPLARALGLIERLGADGEVRPSHLASALEITPRSVTDVVDALESRGLVRREPSSSDRRAIALLLTPQGHEMRRRLADGRYRQTRELTSALTASERAQLSRLLTKVLEEEGERDGRPASPR